MPYPRSASAMAKQVKQTNPNKVKDFKKPKKKLGRTMAQSTATRTAFQTKAIQMPVQSILQDDGGGLVTRRQQSLEDLLAKLRHPTPKVKVEGLLGLQELSLRFGAEKAFAHSAALSSVLERTLELVMEPSASVRRALLLFFEAAFADLRRSSVAPFSALLQVYLVGGLTHTTSAIRRTALQLLLLLAARYPSVVSSPAFLSVLLRNLVHLFSALSSSTALLQSSSHHRHSHQHQQHQQQQQEDGPSEQSEIRVLMMRCLLALLPDQDDHQNHVEENGIQQHEGKVVDDDQDDDDNVNDNDDDDDNDDLIGSELLPSSESSLLLTSRLPGSQLTFFSSQQASRQGNLLSPADTLAIVDTLLQFWLELSPGDSLKLSSSHQSLELTLYCLRTLLKRHVSAASSAAPTEQASFSHASQLLQRSILLRMGPHFPLHTNEGAILALQPANLALVASLVFAVAAGEHLSHKMRKETLKRALNWLRGVRVADLPPRAVAASAAASSGVGFSSKEQVSRELLALCTQLLRLEPSLAGDAVLSAVSLFEDAQLPADIRRSTLGFLRAALGCLEDPFSLPELRRWLLLLPKALWQLKLSSLSLSREIIGTLCHLGRCFRATPAFLSLWQELQPHMAPFFATLLPGKPSGQRLALGPFCFFPAPLRRAALDLLHAFPCAVPDSLLRSLSYAFATATMPLDTLRYAFQVLQFRVSAAASSMDVADLVSFTISVLVRSFQLLLRPADLQVVGLNPRGRKRSQPSDSSASSASSPLSNSSASSSKGFEHVQGISEACCHTLFRLYPTWSLAFHAVAPILTQDLDDDAILYALLCVLAFDGHGDGPQGLELPQGTLGTVAAGMVRLLLRPGFITEQEGEFYFPPDQERFLVGVCQVEPNGQRLASEFLRRLLAQLSLANLSLLSRFLVAFLPRLVITSSPSFDRPVLAEWAAEIHKWASDAPPEPHFVSKRLLSELLLSLELV
ncbi:MAG: hypothetical protein Q8P67_06610 [archaeon]|nr:hypothetical protein [archaeon]